MTTSSERPHESNRNARLLIRSAYDFNVRRQGALNRREIQENVIYEARATSRRLENEGKSISFDVLTTSVHETGGFLAFTSFRLAALDDDFQPFSFHRAHMQNKMWRIPRDVQPITILPPNHNARVDGIRLGYLLRKVDLLNDELDISVSYGEQLRSREVPPLLQQRSHPLQPVRDPEELI